MLDVVMFEACGRLNGGQVRIIRTLSFNIILSSSLSFVPFLVDITLISFLLASLSHSSAADFINVFPLKTLKVLTRSTIPFVSTFSFCSY